MYKISFIDGTIFNGGTPHASKWNEIPDKLIEKLEYQINKTNIVLKGYELYNHFVEQALIVQKGQYISNLILMGKKGKNVLKIIYNFSTGKIKYDTVYFGKEYRNKSTAGWKKGIKSDKKPICKIY